MKPIRFFATCYPQALTLLLGLVPLSASASADFDPDANDQVEAVVQALTEQGADREAVLATLSEARFQQPVIDAISRPAERSLTWGEYRNIFIQDERVEGGAAFIDDNLEAMERAEETYGVPREVIAAIIGVETYYGRHMGDYRVLDALSTLAFRYPPRSEFFTGELESFITLTGEQALDPTELMGSYAGAMGLAQFMPSSYQAYAVDFDDDGVKDLWENPTDAIGSVANYLAEHGWRGGEAITVGVQLVDGEAPTDVEYNLTEPPYVLADDLERDGLLPGGSLGVDRKVVPLALEQSDGEMYYLFGLYNFYVITRYNHSHLYAMAVTTLAEQIREERS